MFWKINLILVCIFVCRKRLKIHDFWPNFWGIWWKMVNCHICWLVAMTTKNLRVPFTGFQQKFPRGGPTLFLSEEFQTNFEWLNICPWFNAHYTLADVLSGECQFFIADKKLTSVGRLPTSHNKIRSCRGKIKHVWFSDILMDLIG